MRRAILLAAAPLLASASQPDPLAVDRGRLAAARRAADAAADRAAALERVAAAERDAARRIARRRLALVARIDRAEADLVAARARVAVLDELARRQRTRLDAGQRPAGQLIGALAAFARRPALVAVAQPGSVDDLVHVRAVLGSTLPVIRSRTAALRAELAETRALRTRRALAAGALEDAQATLIRERQTLAALEARHGARATALGRNALSQSDRAIALGEAARDIVDRMAQSGSRQEVLADLSRLPGPPAIEETQTAAAPVYQRPVPGRLVTGFGELSAAGVRARGLTFAVAPGELVRAPAAGRIVFARPLRGYGIVVMIDHGAGWTSVLTGLAGTPMTRGEQVRAGDPVGAATAGQDAAVTIELYRNGRAVDAAAMIG